MPVGKYISRSVKYLIKLVILLALLFALMILSETSTLNPENFMDSFFGSLKGQLLMIVLVLWSAFYPKVEFVSRHMNSDLAENRDAIVRAFAAGGMIPGGEERGKMVFRGQSMARRLWFLWDDAVTVTANPAGGFDMEGPRRFVGEAQSRIPGYIDAANTAHNEEY